jgi:NADPH2:quinone reductase
MRAMVIDRFGGSDELHLADVPIPEPAPGQLLIRMVYAGVNPADWKARAGLLKPLERLYRFPITLGMDGAGVVERVGPGVEGFRPGDRVLTLSGLGPGLQGTYAEVCCAPVRRTAPIPAGLDFAAAASIPIAAASAASSILDVAKVKAGERVLLNGGAGGVGAFAIPFLRHLGARVAATCSTRNLDYVRSLGAERVIDYTREDVLEALGDWAPEGVDAVIDAVGQHSLPADTPRVIRPGGVLVTITNLLTGTEAFDLEGAAARDVRVLDNVEAARTPDMRDFQVDAFHQMLAAIAEGAVRPPPYEVMPLEQAGAAHDRVQDGHVRGKIVLEIAELAP